MANVCSPATSIGLLFISLLFIGLAVAQERATLPVKYNATTLQGSGDGESCPPADQQDAVRTEISQNISRLLQDTVVPALNRSYGACGCGGVGWTRVAYLDMTDNAQQCPLNWTLITTPKRSCGRTTGTADYNCCCDSATFSVQGVQYSQVCGRIIAYQVGHPEAFAGENIGFPMTIDGPYVDGVSVTHGNPRQHIWTFACALSETARTVGICPCTDTNYLTTINIPSYIGEDYFCETGVPPGESYSSVFYSDDPLWDGNGCGPTSTCCTFNDPPWFCQQLPQTTTDDIEVRLCSIQDIAAENVPVELIEIYVK